MKQIKNFVTGINLAAGLVLLNVFLSFYPFWKIDLTENKIHSLSEASRVMAKNLEDVIQIKVYISGQLPTQVKPVATSLKTIVDEFARLNPAKIKVTYVDPLTDKKAEQEAIGSGIQPLQFSSVKADKFEVSSGYLGLMMMFGSEKEVLPVASDVGNLEYFLVSGIKRLISDNKEEVAVVNNLTQDQGQISYLAQYLTRDYAVTEMKTEQEDWPDEAKLVLWIGNSGKKADNQEKMNEWLAGRAVLAFVDGAVVDGTNMSGTKSELIDLEEYLKNNGLTINRNLVLDESSTIANFRSDQGAFISQYPYWIEVRPENISKVIPAVSGLSGLMLPWASSIETGQGVEKLFESSQNSWIDQAMTDLSPVAIKKADSYSGGQVLAAINKDSKVALVASSKMVVDDFVLNKQENLILALNLVDYLMQDETLLKVRSKSIVIYPLAKLSQTQKGLVRYGNVFLPIIITAATAIAVTKLRQKKQANEN